MSRPGCYGEYSDGPLRETRGCYFCPSGPLCEEDTLCGVRERVIIGGAIMLPLCYAHYTVGPEADERRCGVCLELADCRDATPAGSGVSDGSTASYYELPIGATQLQDLISHRDMNSQLGEIFRACYRYGTAEHSPKLRDIKKIIFYAEAEKARLEKLEEK